MRFVVNSVLYPTVKQYLKAIKITGDEVLPKFSSRFQWCIFIWASMQDKRKASSSSESE